MIGQSKVRGAKSKVQDPGCGRVPTPFEASMRQNHGWAERSWGLQASTLGRQCRIENAKWKIVEFPRKLRGKWEIAQASAEIRSKRQERNLYELSSSLRMEGKRYELARIPR